MSWLIPKDDLVFAIAIIWGPICFVVGVIITYVLNRNIGPRPSSMFKVADLSDKVSVQGFIAITLVFSIVGLLYLLALKGQTDTDTFKIMVGAVMTVGFANVVGFYFGSSTTSKIKDDTISALSDQAKSTSELATSLAHSPPIQPAPNPPGGTP